MAIMLILYLLIPAGVILLCRKLKFFGKIGPIVILYFIGAFIGNMPFLPEGTSKLQHIISSAIVPIAIPMMLFNSNFKTFSIKKSMITFLCALIAVLIAIITGYLIFNNYLGDERHKIGGMLTGMYIGGIPNLAALKLMLNVKEETFIILNAWVMIAGFLYVIFLITIGIKLLRKFISGTPIRSQSTSHEKIDVVEPDPYVGIFTKKNIVQILKAMGLSLIIFAVSSGAGMFVKKDFFMVVVILLLTTFGILASFFKRVRALEKSYDAGIYLVYIFCLVIASMASFADLDLQIGIFMFLYAFCIIVLSLIIHAILSKIFKVDADTMIISSVGFILSPPFVPMMAAAMKNKNVIILGMSISIVTYAIGNYFGFIFYEFMKLI